MLIERKLEGLCTETLRVPVSNFFDLLVSWGEELLPVKLATQFINKRRENKCCLINEEHCEEILDQIDHLEHFDLQINHPLKPAMLTSMKTLREEA